MNDYVYWKAKNVSYQQQHILNLFNYIPIIYNIIGQFYEDWPYFTGMYYRRNIFFPICRKNSKNSLNQGLENTDNTTFFSRPIFWSCWTLSNNTLGSYLKKYTLGLGSKKLLAWIKFLVLAIETIYNHRADKAKWVSVSK